MFVPLGGKYWRILTEWAENTSEAGLLLKQFFNLTDSVEKWISKLTFATSSHHIRPDLVTAEYF